MNTPGRAGGNWSWRYLPGMLSPHVADRLRMLTDVYGRARMPNEEKIEDRE
jgi:4-alpha-glucanotransferase